MDESMTMIISPCELLFPLTTWMSVRGAQVADGGGEDVSPRPRSMISDTDL